MIIIIISRNYRCVKFVNISKSSLGVFSDECSTVSDMVNDIGIDKKQQLHIIKKMINIVIRATYYTFCCRNRNWDSPVLMQFWFSFLFFFFFSIIRSQAAFVNCLYVARFTIIIVHLKTQIRFPLFLLFKDLRMQQNVLKKITVRYLWISSTIVKHFSVTSIRHFLPAKISFHKLENLLHELGIFALWETVREIHFYSTSRPSTTKLKNDKTACSKLPKEVRFSLMLFPFSITRLLFLVFGSFHWFWKSRQQQTWH